jgi:hypothetical protein
VFGSGQLIEGFRFETTTTEGAILMLPDGGSSKDVLNKRKLREYATRNAVSWYQFANETLGRDIHNGALYLITGRNSAPAYGVASFSHNAGAGRVVAASFLAVGEGEGDQHQRRYTWSTHHSMSHRTGMSENGLHNQCIFLRGYRIAVNESLLATTSEDVVHLSQIADQVPPELEELPDSIPFGDSASARGTTGATLGSLGHMPAPSGHPPATVDLEPLPGQPKVKLLVYQIEQTSCDSHCT